MSLEYDGFWDAGFWDTGFWEAGFWEEQAPPDSGTVVGTYQTFDLLYPRPFSSSEEQASVELNEAEALLVAMMLVD